jgi:16S rRNA (uracil1498-N3)-methyltransferase
MGSEDLGLPKQPGGTAPHVLVDNVAEPVLGEDDVHHVVKVRRLRDGDLLSVTDGRGSWRWCAIAGSRLDPLSDPEFVPASAPALSVGFALVKGSKPELMVQKLTELGIDNILPFVADRSVVRWDEAKVDRNHDRLVKVSREASMQSRRVWLPTVSLTHTFAELAATDGAVRADRDGAQLTSSHTTVLIGPEGGWSEAEAIASPAVGLGATVLRSETAAISAGVLMMAFRDGNLR